MLVSCDCLDGKVELRHLEHPHEWSNVADHPLQVTFSDKNGSLYAACLRHVLN